MMRKLFNNFLHWAVVMLCLAAVLFAGRMVSQSGGLVASVLREVAAVCRDDSTQWMLVVCLAVYLGFFWFLERRRDATTQLNDPPSSDFGATGAEKGTTPHPTLSPNEAEREKARHLIRPADTFSPVEAEKGAISTPHPNPLVRGGEGGAWLLAFVVICLAGYAWHYSAAVKSLQVLVLLAGIVFGKGMAAWVNWENKTRHLTPTLSPNEAGREETRHLIRPADTFSPVEAEKDGTPGVTRATTALRANGIIFILLALLAGAALWQPETSPIFFYHGSQRWCGVWENPNLYGLLMGVGVILGIGLALRGGRMEDGGWKKHFCAFLCLVAVILCGIGLYKSYSRGAWLGTAVGLIYLFWKQTHLTPALSPRPTGGEGELQPSSILHLPSSRLHAWLRKNRWSLAIILISIAVIGCWQLRFSESLPAQRLASVGNPNDFSWRNRVTAWHGAGRMLLDRPLAGFGWGEAETAYGKNYCPTTESAAIEMNDFLMLGISAGVPAMVCFVIYVLLGLKQRTETGGTRCPTFNEPSSIFHLQSSIRAAVAVLLVGFWFDGGLFKLPVAVVFWTLLELSRLEPGRASRVCGMRAVNPSSEDSAQRSDAPYLSVKPNYWLRGLAALFALAAAGLMTIHLVTPRLAVSERTLEMARKLLVHPKERNNFEALASQPIWGGAKLKTLLDHAELATYNRALVNWPVEEKMFQDFVLSPVINSSTLNSKLSTDLNWRRNYWEEFYPRIRHESSPEDAAKIIVKQLRERGGAGNEFESRSVAALRAVGIPARLNVKHQAEFFDGTAWRLVSQVAP